MRDWLKELRSERGMTQAQLAEKLGISEAYLSYIESGDRQKKMDLALAMKLSGILKIDLREIVENEAK